MTTTSATVSFHAISDAYPVIILFILVLVSYALSRLFESNYVITEVLMALTGVYIIAQIVVGIIFGYITFDQQTAFAPTLWFREMKTAFIFGYFISVIEVTTFDLYRTWDGELPPSTQIECNLQRSAALLAILSILILLTAMYPSKIARYTPLWAAEKSTIRQIILPTLVAVFTVELSVIIKLYIFQSKLSSD